MKVTVSAVFPWKCNVGELEAFIAKAKEHGLTTFTWTADSGSQREPAQLTMIATEND